MITVSNIKPTSKFELEKFNGRCDVLFFENIEQFKNCDNEIMYRFDMYRLSAIYRNNLRDDICNNFDTWIDVARKEESKEKVLSDKENILKLKEEINRLEIEQGGYIFDNDYRITMLELGL